MVQLAKVYDEILTLGSDLWAVAPQEMEATLALRQRRQLPFPILADVDQIVIRRWGLFNELDPKQRPIPYPATYVISQSGNVHWSHVGLTTRDRPTPGEILAAVKSSNSPE